MARIGGDHSRPEPDALGLTSRYGQRANRIQSEYVRHPRAGEALSLEVAHLLYQPIQVGAARSLCNGYTDPHDLVPLTSIPRLPSYSIPVPPAGE